jgi:hypothetical protein
MKKLSINAAQLKCKHPISVTTTLMHWMFWSPSLLNLITPPKNLNGEIVVKDEKKFSLFVDR